MGEVSLIETTISTVPDSTPNSSKCSVKTSLNVDATFDEIERINTLDRKGVHISTLHMIGIFRQFRCSSVTVDSVAPLQILASVAHQPYEQYYGTVGVNLMVYCHTSGPSRVHAGQPQPWILAVPPEAPSMDVFHILRLFSPIPLLRHQGQSDPGRQEMIKISGDSGGWGLGLFSDYLVQM